MEANKFTHQTEPAQASAAIVAAQTAQAQVPPRLRREPQGKDQVKAVQIGSKRCSMRFPTEPYQHQARLAHRGDRQESELDVPLDQQRTGCGRRLGHAGGVGR
jgi:hypothetical protein